MRYYMFHKILVPINPLKKDQDFLIKNVFNYGIEQNATVNFIYFGVDKEAVNKLKEYVEKGRQLGLDVKYESVKFEGQNSEIPEKIAEYAENFDIVIMGHLKFDKIYRFVHQSTAADLINMVSIPIMVIPEDGKCEFILEENVDKN